MIQISSPCIFFSTRVKTCEPKHSPISGLHILASVLVWSIRWKEERIIWTSLTHRWPKALLYHSGDLPLWQDKQISHIMIAAWIQVSDVRTLEVLSHLRSTLEMCVSLVLPGPLGSRRYCDSSTTRRTAAMRGLSSWSTDTHTSAHEPLHRSVRHDLCRETE